MLISAMVGLDSRTTMDMDATIKGIDFSKDVLSNMIIEIIDEPIQDDVKFYLKGLEEIRDDDEYGGYRVSLEAFYETMKVWLKIDISTGDIITPKEVVYKFDLLFEDRTIEILAYNLETVLAEKYETIISRGIINTRARDFYDVYVLTTLQYKNINKDDFRKAVVLTSTKRKSFQKMNNALKTIEEIRQDSTMQNLWKSYVAKFDYANDVLFEHTIEAVIKLFDMYNT